LWHGVWINRIFVAVTLRLVVSVSLILAIQFGNLFLPN